MTFVDFVTPVPADWLNNVNAFVNTPLPTPTYTAPYAGSTSRSSTSKWSDVISVLDFAGVDPTGATDSTAGMQAAHNTGQVIYYPPGTYNFTTLNITSGGIVGMSSSLTILNSTDTSTGDIITVNANSPIPGPSAPLFKQFRLQSLGLKTDGSGISITAPVVANSENQAAQFYDVITYGPPIGLHFIRAAYWTVLACKFLNYTISGVQVENQDNPDSGDHTIMGCHFITSVGSNQVAVGYQSSGGMKLIGNKMLGGSYGLLVGLTAPTSTSDLMVVGNSIEVQLISIALTRTSGSATFSNINIVSNQLGALNGITCDNSGAFNNVVVRSNNISLPATSGGAAIQFLSGSNFTIDGNVMISNGSAQTGIAIAAACSNGRIGAGNIYTAFSQPYSVASATTFFNGTQRGSGTITTSTAFGANFFGSTTVVFAAPFAIAPAVHVYPNTSAGGGIAGYASGTSPSGFTANIVGSTNGGSVGYSWDAQSPL